MASIAVPALPPDMLQDIERRAQGGGPVLEGPPPLPQDMTREIEARVLGAQPAVAQPALGPPPPRVDNFFEGIGGAAQRGWSAARLGGATLDWLTGGAIFNTDESALVREALAAQETVRNAPVTPGYERGAEAVAQANGFWQTLGAYITNPEYSAQALVESLVQSTPAIAGGVAGIAGGPVGVAAGVFAGSAAAEWGSAFWQFLSQQGIDLSNEVAIRLALRDPQLLGEAYSFASTRAAAIGLLDAVGAGVGGRLAGRVLIPDVTTTRRLGGIAGGVAVDTAAGGAGEVAAGALTTGIDWKEVAAEIALGATGGALIDIAPSTFVQALRARRTATEAGGTSPVAGEGITGESPPTPPGATPQATPPLEIVTEPDRPTLADLSRRAARRPDDPFFLRSLDIIEASPMRRGTGQQWLNVLRKGGISDEELTDTGLFETLRQAQAFTREDLLAKGFDTNVETWVQADPYGFMSSFNRGTKGNRVIVIGRKGEDTPERFWHRFDRPGYTTLAWARVEDLDDGGLLVHEVQSSLHQAGEKEGYGDPDLNQPLDPAPLDAPLKERWAQAALGRALRYAADAGYEEVSLADPVLVDKIQGGANEGRRAFYSKRLPDTLRKWAKRLELTTYTKPSPLLVRAEMPTVRVDARARSAIQAGLPLYAKRPTVTSEVVGGAGPAIAPDVMAAVPALHKAFHEVVKQFKLRANLRVQFFTTRSEGPHGNVFGYFNVEGGEYVIRLFLPEFKNVAMLVEKFGHELGHALFTDKRAGLAPEMNALLEEAYERFRTDVGSRPKSLQSVLNRRAGVAELLYGRTRKRKVAEYWISKEEWEADQVARWFTSSEKPLGVIDKWYRGIALLFKKLHETLKRKFGLTATPEQFMQDWLDSFMKEVEPFEATIHSAIEAEGQAENAEALRAAGIDPGAAEPITGATAGQRSLLRKLFGGNVPKDLAAQPALVDNMNWFYKRFLALWQVASLNPKLRPLQTYREASEAIQRTTMETAAIGQSVLHKAAQLGSGQRQAISDLWRSYANMLYLTDEEFAQGVRRLPSKQELVQLAHKHGVNEAGIRVFTGMVNAINTQARLHLEVAMRDAMAIMDPDKQAAAIAAVHEQTRKLMSEPYFPTAVRYGQFGVVARNGAGDIVYVDFTDTQARQAALAREVRRHFASSQGIQVTMINMPREAGPLTAVFVGSLGKLKATNLTAAEREAIQYLEFETSPGSIFRSRAAIMGRGPKSKTGEDFFRIMGTYFFHSARSIGRLKHMDTLHGAMKALRELSVVLPDSDTPAALRGADSQNRKLKQIVDMVQRHHDYTFRTHTDFATIKTATFHWMLGYMVSSAMLNLSQMPLVTVPFLAGKFGAAKALAAIGRAAASKSTHYKKGTIEAAGLTRFDMKALDLAVKMGYVNETLAAEIAGMAEGHNLTVGFGGNLAQRWMFKFLQGSSFMFHMAEQMNRRVTFMAGLWLAMENPDAAYVKEAMTGHSALYEDLRSRGWPAHEAKAFITAIDAVDWTQGRYGKGDRAPIFRGIGGVLFIFKSFMQQMLFTMVKHPKVRMRMMLAAGFAGGLMGLPGGDDLLDLIKTFARILGKDVDPERELREMLVDGAGWDSESADMLIHGFGREGFGIPALLGLLGADFLPEVDRSASIGYGRVLPFQIGQVLGPRSGEGLAPYALQSGLGAAMGQGVAFFRALSDAHLAWNDSKRWEGAMPRWMGNLFQAERLASEGYERTRAGDPILVFDRTNPEHMAEIIAVGLGYQPTRLARQWDNYIAKQEVVAYWDVRRELLLRRAGQALEVGDQEGFRAAMADIVAFNAELRDLDPAVRPQAISADTVRQSMRSRNAANARQGQGLPLRDKDYMLYQELDRLYPNEEIIDVRRVR